MMKLVHLVLALFFCLTKGQQYQQPPQGQVYFPSDPSPTGRFDQNPNEVLGNYFNGQLPSSSPPQQAYTPQVQVQPQINQGFGFGQFGNNFVGQTQSSPTAQTSIPRQTHFFGNNYDFFRQFHDVGPQRPTFQSQFRPSTPFQSNTVSSSSPAPTTPSFATTQYFPNSQPSSPFTSFPFSPGPTFPSTPFRHQNQQPTVTYPLTVVKSTQPSQNSLFNGYEEAAKALGITHGLRVITTETLKSHPTLSLATVDTTPKSTATTEPPKAPSSPSTTQESPSSTPQPIIVRNTGRVVAKLRSTTEGPKVIVVNRQPLFREPNRVVNFNELEPIQHQRRPNSLRAEVPTTYRPTSVPTEVPTTTLKPLEFTSRPLFQQHQGHGLYNANHLIPGQLYHNTNGAYQAYYTGGQQGQQGQQGQGQLDQRLVQQVPVPHPGQVGLEEVIPQVIEFNIPHKMIPLPEANEDGDQGFDPFRPISYESGPLHQLQPEQRPVQVIVQSTRPPATKPPPTPKKADNGEVYRVGPKGRLLKKRRRVRPQPKVIAQPDLSPQPQPQPQALSSYQVQPRTQGPPATPTTYRPQFDVNVNAHSSGEEEVTTYRSKFRYSPTSPPTPQVAIQSTTQSPEGQAQVIQSRLKSLERQIRFKNRSKNAK